MAAASASMPTPPPEDLSPSKAPSTDFDIVAHFNNLLITDPALTTPVAAIESLIALLSASPASTVSETLDLLESSSTTLKASVPNPIALSAGTDLFRRYIISTLQSRAATSATAARTKRSVKPGDDDFNAVRTHLLSNGKVFVERAKEARGQIAAVAKGFVRDGSTVLTCGRSRVVAAVLDRAATEGVEFRVVYVRDSSPSGNGEEVELVRDLRGRGVPVATIPFAALASAVEKVSFVMVGAESVVENGGVISGMGTYQLGLLAKCAKRPFYVVAESHKFVRVYPLGGEDSAVGGNVLHFRAGEGEEGTGYGKGGEGAVRERKDGDAVDFTPPELIRALVTESGVHTPSAVSEELIKMWY